MAVFRIERTKDYTVMSNHHLRNHELSLKAKGLLSMMLSLPDDWNYTTPICSLVSLEVNSIMSHFLEALNRPSNAYHKRYKGIAWLLVAITILIVTVLDSLLRKVADTSFQIDGPQLLKTIVLGVASYLLICTVMWLVCKCFGSKTNIQSYIQTWGISFFPNIICSIVVCRCPQGSMCCPMGQT